MFSFNLRVIDAPGVFHEGRFLLDVVIHDVASSTATKQRRIRPFGSPDENVSVVRPSNPFEWPLTTRQIGRRARLELPRGRVVYAKGVTELLTDIGCEAWRVDGKLQHVREVFWRRSGNGVIEAEVLIETEANVVTIEAVGELLEVKQMLLKRTSDGRLQQRLCQNHRKLWKVCNDLPFH